MSGIVDQPDEGSSGRPGAFELLRRRDFGLYWWAGMLSSPGNWLYYVTASVLIFEMTDSPLMVGILNFANFVPTLLFSLPAGALGDRFDKRRIVTAAAIGGSTVAAGLTVLSAIGLLTPWMLVGLCFLIGTARAVAKPSLNAMIPLLVPRTAVARATALNVMQFQIGQIAGPLLASVLLLAATPSWAFGLNAVSFVAPIIAMQLIRLRPSAGPSSRATESVGWSDAIVEGLRFIRRTVPMPAILASVVLCNGAGEALRTLAPTIAADLGRSEVAGVVIMGYSVGALVGLLTFGVVERLVPRRWMLAVAFGLQAFGTALVCFAPNIPLAVLAAAPIGMGFSLSIPLLSATMQELAPDDYRSRVMSVFAMAHLGFRPVFALIAGGVASVLSAQVALATFAAMAIAAAGHARYRRD